MSEFLYMGGYGLYVWGAYAVTLGLLAFEVCGLAWKERAIRARLEREISGAPAR